MRLALSGRDSHKGHPTLNYGRRYQDYKPKETKGSGDWRTDTENDVVGSGPGCREDSVAAEGRSSSAAVRLCMVCSGAHPNLWPDNKDSSISEIQENITDHGCCQADQYVLDAGQEYNQPSQRQHDQGVL